MLRSTEKIIENHLDSHVIRDSDLDYLFKGSAASRHALIHKALKKEELTRLCRGFYILAPKYQKELMSEYCIANRIAPNSFISAESALSFHQWIPERVTQVTSIIAFGRSHEFMTPLGSFLYKKMPIAAEHFYLGVDLSEYNEQYFYIATPLRALMDYVYWHKIKNANSHFLLHSLRIEEHDIATITKKEIQQLLPVYKSSYVSVFLKNLLSEI